MSDSKIKYIVATLLLLTALLVFFVFKNYTLAAIFAGLAVLESVLATKSRNNGH